MKRARPAWAPIVLAVILTSCQESGGPAIVARAGGQVFTVDDVVNIFAAEPRLPNDPQVIEQLAELWVDYTLVALAAREDTLLENVDLDALVAPQLEQLVVDRYVEMEAPVDTVLSEEELRNLWEDDPPRGQIQARHILLTYPLNATSSQRDSVRTDLMGLRDRVASGASFEGLAREFSQDQGSAEFGGDLGTFGPGDMVGAFEDAVYALEVGEISDVVETPFGLHLIRLDARESVDFEAGKEGFRRQVVMNRLRTSDSLFLAAIEEEFPVTVSDGSVEITREVARRYRERLSRRAEERGLVTFAGGDLTAGELWDFLQTRTSQFAQQVAAASDEDLDLFLRNLGQSEVLLARAASAGMDVSPAQADSVEGIWREQVVQAADAMGLRLITAEAGETSDQTIARAIRQVIGEVASGARSAIPMNAATVALREELDAAVLAPGVSRASARLAELRAPLQVPVTAPPTVDSSATPADTVEGG